MAQSKTYLDADGNEIKGTGTYLDDSGSIAGPTPPEGKTAPNLRAVGGDTIKGHDPNANPGVIDRVNAMLEGLAHPQSVADLAGLVIPSSEGLAMHAIRKTGPVVEATGRTLSKVGETFKPVGRYAGVADVLYHRGGLVEGAATAAAPYAVDLAGRGLQATGRAMQRETPLLQFEAPAVNVVRPSASVVEAAKEAAPAVKDAVATSSKSVKPILNAMEMKEYMRLTRAGKSHAEAMELIDAQNALRKRLNLPSSEKVRQAVQSRNETGRWED